jgi:hypothetical protein
MATKANLVIDQGATFSTSMTLEDVNGDYLQLGGYTANSQIRKWYTSSNAAAVFAVSADNTGTLTLSLSANQTSSLASGRYVYDVILSSGNVVSRVVEGIVTVTPKVTR